MSENKTRPILVTGANGMLGRDLLKVLASSKRSVIATDSNGSGEASSSLDISNEMAVKSFVGETKPRVIVNCAAYTNVDGAESDSTNAYLVNAIAVAHLALAAAQVNARLIHISTDYVFSAMANRESPLAEDEKCDPKSVYGASKLYGELLLRQILPQQSVILRTSWLHGVNGGNFIDTMLKLAKERNSISVVNDQIGSPTWTVWLAQIIDRFIDREDLSGVFHASSRGGISWNDFAKEIFRQAGLDIEVTPQTTEEMGRPAPRPLFSTLDVSKLEAALELTAPDWQLFVTEHLRAQGVIK